MVKQVKIKESELRQLVMENVKKVLYEFTATDDVGDFLGAEDGGYDGPTNEPDWDEGMIIKQLCFGLVNGDIKSTFEKCDGDFDGSCDIIVKYNGGEINATCYEEDNEYIIASAEIEWNGDTLYVDENNSSAKILSRCLSCLAMKPDVE